MRVKYGEGKYRQFGPFTYHHALNELEKISRKHYPHWVAVQKMTERGQTA